MKTNSKWITDLNVKLETLKLLEENIGEILPDTGTGKDVLNRIPKTQEIRAGLDKWDCIKIKTFKLGTSGSCLKS
jgi:hypothetical protein